MNPETLFEGERPESVGGGKDNEEAIKGKEAPADLQEDGASPDENFYSSIAGACMEEGVFPDLDGETIGKVKTAEDFRGLIESQIKAGLDERQRRVDEALSNGADPTDIKKYENTLGYLDSLTEKAVSEESEKGEQLRRNLIFQDFINRGYSQEKAQKFTDRTIEAGTDIADAKEALQSNREFFQKGYDKLLEDARKEAEKAARERKVQAEKLKESILKDKQLFGDLDIDQATRKKVFDNISRPVYKDPDTGEYYTALQKYEMEHRADFLKYAGLIYTLTDGFKDFDGFTRGKVRKEVRKGFKELEQVLRHTGSNAKGGMRLVTNAEESPGAFLGKGVRLDF